MAKVINILLIRSPSGLGKGPYLVRLGPGRVGNTVFSGDEMLDWLSPTCQGTDDCSVLPGDTVN